MKYKVVQVHVSLFTPLGKDEGTFFLGCLSRFKKMSWFKMCHRCVVWKSLQMLHQVN